MTEAPYPQRDAPRTSPRTASRGERTWRWGVAVLLVGLLVAPIGAIVSTPSGTVRAAAPREATPSSARLGAAPSPAGLLAPSVGSELSRLTVSASPQDARSGVGPATAAASVLSYSTSTLFPSNQTLLPGNLPYGEYGLAPAGVAYASSNGMAYVADADTDNVSVVNPVTGVVSGIIAVGDAPQAIAYATKSQTIFVANYGDNDLSAIATSTDRVVATIGVGTGPIGLAYDAKENSVFVANIGSDNVSVVNATTHRVIATVDVGSGADPLGIAWDSANDTIFVGDQTGTNALFSCGCGNLSVISGSSNQLIATPPIYTYDPTYGVYTGAAFPWGLAYDTASNSVYITGEDAQDTLVSLESMQASTYVITFSGIYVDEPTWIAYSPVTEEIYGIDGYGWDIFVVNGSTETRTLAAGNYPFALGYIGAIASMYIANPYSDNLTVISRSDRNAGNVIIGLEIVDLAYDPTNQVIYAVNASGDSLLGISAATNRLVSSVTVGVEPDAVAYASASNELYVALEASIPQANASGNIVIVNPGTDRVVGSISLNLLPAAQNWLVTPTGIAYDPTLNEVFVSAVVEENYTSSTPNDVGYEFTINPSTNLVTTQLANVGDAPAAVAADGRYASIFVVDEKLDRVTVINASSASIALTVPVGSTPLAIDVVASLDQVEVPNAGDSSVNEFSAATDLPTAVFTTAPVPVAATYANGTSGTLWAVSEGGVNLATVINPLTNSTVAYVPTGNAPDAVVSDFESGSVYVANVLSGSVSIYSHVIYHAYNVTFEESGLPAHAAWSLQYGSYTATSTGTSVYLGALPNATYAFVVRGSDGYAPTQATFSITIHGGAVVESVSFLAAYAVTFRESGLPSGATWYVNLTGQPALSGVVGATPRNLTTALVPGSYVYVVATNEKVWWTTATGSITVASSAQTVAVAYSAFTYGVTFTESGLPLGVLWYVNITGQPSLSATVGPDSGLSVSTIEQNGSFGYRASASDPNWSTPSPSSFRVRGAPASVAVPYTLVTYAVTFSEFGLPGGTTWYVNVSGEAPASALVTDGLGTQISISLPNGLLAYSIGVNNKSWATNATGQVEVNGAPVSVSVPFALFTYGVAFTETGLPSGRTWTVGVGSASVAWTNYTMPTGEPIVARLPNGSFGYSIARFDGYQQTNVSANGTGVVSGENVGYSLAFFPTPYPVTLTESGLPAGTSWSVTVTATSGGGPTYSNATTGTAVTLGIPNGSYRYRISPIAGFSGAWGAPFKVSGQPESLKASFTVTEYALTFYAFGLPAGEAWNLTIGGTTVLSTTSQATVNLPNGTYAYAVSAPGSGYTASPSQGKITVNGASPAAVTITFGTPSSGLSTTDLLLIAAGGAGAVIVIVLVLVVRRRPRSPARRAPPRRRPGAAPAPARRAASPAQPAPPAPVAGEEEESEIYGA